MIELTVLPSRIKPAIGYVIVEVPYLTKTDSGGFEVPLVADTTVGELSVRSGTIFSCGSTDVVGHNYSWDSPLQVKEEERVWWVPNAVSQINTALDEQHRILKFEDRLFLTIPYKSLVMKFDGEYHGLNDYVISELVPEKSEFDISMVEPSGQVHKVVAKPLPGITYRKQGKADPETPIEVEKGMTVVLRQGRKLFLENESNMELPGRWVGFQSRMIVAKINE